MTMRRADDISRALSDIIRRLELLEQARERWPDVEHRLDRLTVADGVYPAANEEGRVGRADRRFNTLHAREIYADTVYADIKGTVETEGKTWVIPDYFVAAETIYANDVICVDSGGVYRATSGRRRKGVGVAVESATAGNKVKTAVQGIARVVCDEAIVVGDILVISGVNPGRVKKQNTVDHVVGGEAEHTHQLTGSTGGPSSTSIVPTQDHTHTIGTPNDTRSNAYYGGDPVYHSGPPEGLLMALNAARFDAATAYHTHGQGATGGPSATKSVASDTHLHTINNQPTGAGSEHTHTVEAHDRGLVIGKALTATTGPGEELDALLWASG